MKHTLIGFITLAGGILALDQTAKHKIEQMSPEQFPKKAGKLPVTLHRSHNRGIFMNMLEDRPKAAAGLSSGALGLFSAAYLPALRKSCSASYMTGAALITGGALSNVYDHLKRGYVVDYFSLPVKPIRHIIFNIGDFSIFTGLFALLWDQLHS